LIFIHDLLSSRSSRIELASTLVVNGSASQRAVGTAVFGGMVASTVLAVLFIPVFFVIFQRLSEFRRKSDEPSAVELSGAKPEHTA